MPWWFSSKIESQPRKIDVVTPTKQILQSKKMPWWFSSKIESQPRKIESQPRKIDVVTPILFSWGKYHRVVGLDKTTKKVYLCDIDRSDYQTFDEAKAHLRTKICDAEVIAVKKRHSGGHILIYKNGFDELKSLLIERLECGDLYIDHYNLKGVFPKPTQTFVKQDVPMFDALEPLFV